MFKKLKKITLKKMILSAFVGFIILIIASNIITYFLYTSPTYEIGNKYTISKDNKTLYFRGDIDAHEFKRFTHFFHKNINNFVVNSSGGDIKQAILIAEVLSKNAIKVIVDGVCGSSCANYYFVSGKQREIRKNSFLLYHGGLSDGTFTMIDTGYWPVPNSFMTLFSYWAMYKTSKEYQGFKNREKQLYKNGGVDLSIIRTSRDKIQGGKYHFWSPNKAALNGYGFDTTHFWYPANKKEKRDAIKYVCENKIDYAAARNIEKCEETFSQKFLIE